jgi:hypothetical protein
MRQKFKVRMVAAAWLILLVAMGVGTLRSHIAAAQIMQTPPLTTPQTPPFGASQRTGPYQNDPRQQEILKKMALQRNAARQDQLVKDTNKLLALATELKTDVDKTDKNVLSVDVIKKADEIEKLAKNVKERMKD